MPRTKLTSRLSHPCLTLAIGSPWAPSRPLVSRTCRKLEQENQILHPLDVLSLPRASRLVPKDAQTVCPSDLDLSLPSERKTPGSNSRSRISHHNSSNSNIMAKEISPRTKEATAMVAPEAKSMELCLSKLLSKTRLRRSNSSKHSCCSNSWPQTRYVQSYGYLLLSNNVTRS
jgi:hypothetical protein